MVLVCVGTLDWYTAVLLSVTGLVSGLLLAVWLGSKNLAISITFLDVLVFLLWLPGVLGRSWVFLGPLVMGGVEGEADISFSNFAATCPVAVLLSSRV